MPESTAPLDLALAMDQLEVGVALLDAGQNVLFCNQWLCRHSHRERAALIGRPFADIFPESENSRLAQALTHAIVDRLPSLISPALHGTLLALYQDESDRLLDRRMIQMIHVMPLADTNARCMLQISDVTANMSRERQLRQQTETLRRTTTLDPLTGVANRRSFDDALAQACREARQNGEPLGLMVVDIDLFNPYNTHYGRDQGDLRLAGIAAAMRTHARPLDIVARYGGDEFVLILPGIALAELFRLAETLRQAVEALPSEDDQDLPLTVSVGVTAMLPGGETDPHTLMSSADVALYQAKHEGRNRAVYFSLEDGSFRNCADDSPL